MIATPTIAVPAGPATTPALSGSAGTGFQDVLQSQLPPAADLLASQIEQTDTAPDDLIGSAGHAAGSKSIPGDNHDDPDNADEQDVTAQSQTARVVPAFIPIPMPLNTPPPVPCAPQTTSVTTAAVAEDVPAVTAVASDAKNTSVASSQSVSAYQAMAADEAITSRIGRILESPIASVRTAKQEAPTDAAPPVNAELAEPFIVDACAPASPKSASVPPEQTSPSNVKQPLSSHALGVDALPSDTTIAVRSTNSDTAAPEQLRPSVDQVSQATSAVIAPVMPQAVTNFQPLDAPTTEPATNAGPKKDAAPIASVSLDPQITSAAEAASAVPQTSDKTHDDRSTRRQHDDSSDTFSNQLAAPDVSDASRSAPDTQPFTPVQTVQRESQPATNHADTSAAPSPHASIQARDSALSAANAAGAVLHSTQLFDKLAQPEMRVGMRTEEFGNVEIRTSLGPRQVNAEISAERGGLGRVLAAEFNGLQQRLRDQDVPLNSLVVHDGNTSGFSGSGSGPAYQEYARSAHRFGDSAAEPVTPVPMETVAALNDTSLLDVCV